MGTINTMVVLEFTYIVFFLNAFLAFAECVIKYNERFSCSWEIRLSAFFISLIFMLVVWLYHFIGEISFFSFGTMTYLLTGSLLYFVREIWEDGIDIGKIAFFGTVLTGFYEYFIVIEANVPEIDMFANRPSPAKGLFVGLVLSFFIFGFGFVSRSKMDKEDNDDNK